jgi:uncharacterized protein (TIGR03000 family)
MYSVVLMAALTAGSAAPDCNLFRGCHGGYGGGHGGYGGGQGGYGGCYGGFNSWYGGCYGGGHYGYGCYGCGGYGGAGYGGYTPVSYGGYGCYGGYGGYGCYGCYGGVPFAAPYVAPQTYLPPTDPKGTDTKGAEQVPPPKKVDKESMGAYRAKVLVQLPADAKLYIDDHLMKATSELRTFQTPQLEPGQVYYYVLRAEVIRDGQKKVETARVILRPGQEVRTAFTTLDTVSTSTVQATKD